MAKTKNQIDIKEGDVNEADINEVDINEADANDESSVNAEPELVPVFIPRISGAKNQPNFEGSLNGRAFTFPRNQWVKLKPALAKHVMKVLEREQAAEDYSYDVRDMLKKQSEEEAKL